MEESNDRQGELGKQPAVGDRVWYKGSAVKIIHIIPPHEWPSEHDKDMDAGMRKYIKPASEKNPPQQRRESLWNWKKWKEPMYIVCYPPDENWTSVVRRAHVCELELSGPEHAEPKKKKKRRT